MPPSPDQNPVSDFLLAAYLDAALDADERTVLEAQLAEDATLRGRLVALYQETKTALDPEAEITIVEKFLAGETVQFAPRATDATPALPNAYDALAEAGEERKRRYLQFGN